MSKKKEEQAKQEAMQQQISRIKLPRNNQTFGVVQQRCGGSRMKVVCFDGKTRICRIPGRLKRRLWVREGNIVIVEPWEFGGGHHIQIQACPGRMAEKKRPSSEAGRV